MKKKRIILLIGLIAIFSILGVSYAWFNYRKEGVNQKLINGELFLYLEDNTDTFHLQNVYPLSVEEARSRTDNVINFTVSGKNTSSSNIHYEIKLVYGDDDENLVRFNDKDLVFDLIEVDENNSETYLLDAVSFNSIDERKIWVDSVLNGQNTEIERNYKLRVWLSDSILISDSDLNADYTAHSGTTTDFKNHYASLRVAVYGDLEEKSLPLTIKTNDNYVENGKSYFLGSVTNDYLLEDEGKSLDSQDIVIVTITNPENKLLFSYTDGGDVSSTSELLTLTYNYIVNRKYDVKVFLESKNDSNVETDLNFVVRKNGEVVQEFVKRVSVIGNNYCLNNGFTKLSDCILVTENLSKNVNDAKTYIASKGSPNVNNTAPIYAYDYITEATITENAITIPSGITSFYYDTFSFNTSNGVFQLSNNVAQSTSLSSDYIGYYSCGGGSSCNTLYKITGVHLDTNKIDGYKFISVEIGSVESEIGLYRVEEENVNKYSYVFRGAVNNNNVKFGDMYWKIIRINSNGTVRMIYNGTTLSNDGNKNVSKNTIINNTNYPYNNVHVGPTYLGFMYNESNTPVISDSFTYTSFSSSDKIYWAEDYELLPKDVNGVTKFKLKTGENNYPLVAMTTTELMNNLNQLTKTPYTCQSVDSDGTCSLLMKVDSITSSTKGVVRYITLSPSSLSQTQSNTIDSNAKKILDSWYVDVFSKRENNDKNVVTYIADNVFCNDRSIMDNTYNSGFLLNRHTYYSGKTRLSDNNIKEAKLMCTNKNDAFTVNDIVNGNGALTYPIGLITADEVSLAGGKTNYKNNGYYLKSGSYYWTMTPFWYTSAPSSTMFVVGGTGTLSHYNVTGTSFGLRPVINLNSNVSIIRGDGTPSNPYIIE